LRVKSISTGAEVLIKTNRYRINWEKSGASNLERQFRDLIYPYWKNQVVLYQCFVPGSQLRLDFLNCNKRLCVEINGAQHDKFNKFFHNNSRNVWLASMRRDNRKQRWLEENNITLLELVQEDLDLFSPDYISKKFEIDIL